MENPVNALELAQKDVNFQSFINCKLTLKNGTKTVLWAFVPKGISFEEIAMGLDIALKKSAVVHCVEKDVYTLRKEQPISLFGQYNKIIFK